MQKHTPDEVSNLMSSVMASLQDLTEKKAERRNLSPLKSDFLKSTR